MSGYVVSVWLHVLGAAVWIGSMVFFAAVVVPVLRRHVSPEAAPSILRSVGARFRILGWITLVVLLVTGVTNLHFRGVTWALAADPAFWSSGFGRLLQWKLGFVALVVVVTAAHELLAGPGAEDASSERARRFRRRASWLGRSVLLLSLVILMLAVMLVRGAAG